MRQLKAVLFEAPDSLVDTGQWGQRVAFNAAFREAHLDWYWDAALYDELRLITDEKARIQYYLENFHLQCGFQQDVSHLIERLQSRQQQHYQQLAQSGAIPLRSGVQRLLAELISCEVRLVLVDMVKAAPAADGIKSLFADVIPYPVHTVSMPENASLSDQFLTALRQLDLPPENCLAIVSSTCALRAAQAADLPTLVISSFYSEQQNFPGALSVIDTFGAPDQPYQLFAGKILTSSYVTAQALQELHGSII
jgi:beta-phosphoglucomutase-like phosphatase (HAD superfamily)